MDMDEILHEIGEGGKYQNLMLWFVFLPIHLTFGCHAYSHLFMAWTPEHWCRTPELAAANLSEHLVRYLTVPPEVGGPGHSRCKAYKLDYSRHTEHNTIVLKEPNASWPTVKCESGWVYNRSLFMDRETAVTKWDLVCEQRWLPLIALTSFLACSLLGQCLGLLCANKFGKRSMFFVFLFVQSFSGVATAFSPNFITFFIFRCLVGSTVPAVMHSPSSLAMELMGASSHSQVSLLCSAAKSLGLALLAGIVIFVGDWANLALASTVPFLAFFLYSLVTSCAIIQQLVRVFPESPRWLLATGRYEETGRVLRNIANTNGRGLMPDYVVGLKRRFRVELALQEAKQKDTGGHTVCDLFSTPNMRRRFILLIFIWFFSSTSCVGLTYFSLQVPSGRSIQVNFAACAVAEVAAVVVASLTLCCVGRRWASLTFSALSGTFCLMMAFMPKHSGWIASMLVYSTAKLLAHSSNVILPVWTREQLPLVTRESAFHFIETLSLIGPIAVPIIIHQGEQYNFLPLSVFGGLQMLTALLAIGLPETSHMKTLHTMHDAEMFGKYWKWKDYFRGGPTKSDHKNGILKTMERKSHSPILGLLRKRDSFHLANAEGEIEVLECNFDSPSKEDAVKVTVL